MRRALLLALLVLAVAAPSAAAVEDPFTIGMGRAPHIAIDAADTAHVAWADEPGSLHYCRMPRGATACDVLTQVDTGTMDDPFVLVEPGGAVAIVMAHDGEARTYAWHSADGGTTWGPRTTIYAWGGAQQVVEPVLGPRPGEVTFTAWDPSGASAWTAALDGSEAASTAHASFPQSFDPRVAVAPGGGVLLVDALREGPVRFRRTTPGADPSDTSAWSAPQRLSEGHTARVAARGDAAYSLVTVPHVDEDTGETTSTHVEARRWTGTGFGPATRIDAPASGSDLHVGPSGAVAAVWFGRGIQLAVSRDGGATFATSPLAFEGASHYEVALKSDDTGLAVFGTRRGASLRVTRFLIRVADTEPEEVISEDSLVRFPGTPGAIGAKLLLHVSPLCSLNRGRFRALVTAEPRGGRRSAFRRIVRVDYFVGDRLVARDRRGRFEKYVPLEGNEPGVIYSFRAVATVRLRGGRTVRREITYRYRIC